MFLVRFYIYIFGINLAMCLLSKSIRLCVLIYYYIIHAEYSYSYADIPQLLGQLIPVTFGHQTFLGVFDDLKEGFFFYLILKQAFCPEKFVWISFAIVLFFTWDIFFRRKTICINRNWISFERGFYAKSVDRDLEQNVRAAHEYFPRDVNAFKHCVVCYKHYTQWI